MPRRLAALSALVLPLAAVAAVAPASSARADDTCATFGDTFSVTNVRMDARAVRVSGLGATPVRFTMTTHADLEPSSNLPDRLWNRMQLRQAKDAGEGPVVHLSKVSESGKNATWRGVFYATGPTHTITFDTALGDIRTCELGRQNVPTELPPLRITAVNTPVVRPTKVAPVTLRARSYTVSGRVLSTTGKPYGRRLTVRVGRGEECMTSNAGLAVRTDAAGRFTAALPNVPAMGSGAPVVDDHCVRLPGSTRDALGNVTDLAFTKVAVPWTHRFSVTAPRTVKKGTKVTVRSAAPLPVWTEVRLERLSGRSTWTQVGWGPIRESGRIDAETVPDVLGAHTYRLRTTDSKAISAPFVMTTTR